MSSTQFKGTIGRTWEVTYVCATCSEHFTRKYSAIRHNHNIHNSRAEIDRLLDYLVGRASGQYMASPPFWYKRNEKSVQSHPATFRVGDTFQNREGLQQAPLEVSQYSTTPILPTHTAGFTKTGGLDKYMSHV